jgi:hypothetical protein
MLGDELLPVAAVEELEKEVGFVLYTLKTTPGLRMPIADECDRSEFQSVFEVDEEEDLLGLLSWEPAMVTTTRRRVFYSRRNSGERSTRSPEPAAVAHFDMHVAARPLSTL